MKLATVLVLAAFLSLAYSQALNTNKIGAYEPNKNRRILKQWDNFGLLQSNECRMCNLTICVSCDFYFGDWCVLRDVDMDKDKGKSQDISNYVQMCKKTECGSIKCLEFMSYIDKYTAAGTHNKNDDSAGTLPSHFFYQIPVTSYGTVIPTARYYSRQKSASSVRFECNHDGLLKSNNLELFGKGLRPKVVQSCSIDPSIGDTAKAIFGNCDDGNDASLKYAEDVFNLRCNPHWNAKFEEAGQGFKNSSQCFFDRTYEKVVRTHLPGARKGDEVDLYKLISNLAKKVNDWEDTIHLRGYWVGIYKFVIELINRRIASNKCIGSDPTKAKIIA